MPTRAVVFDLYGTLIDEFTLATAGVMQAGLADALGVERETFARLWAETYSERATGPFEPSLRGLCETAGAAPDDDQVARALEIRLRHLRAGLTPRTDAEETLAKLRVRGLKLGLVTECSDGVPTLWSETAFAQYFDAEVFTCEVGVRKPARILYDLVCERLGVDAGDCVYVGDGGGYELGGAAEAGMQPILIVTPHAEWLHPEAEAWNGPRVSSLREVLALV